MVGAGQIFVALVPSSQTRVSKADLIFPPFLFSFFLSATSVLTCALYLLTFPVWRMCSSCGVQLPVCPEGLPFGLWVTSGTQMAY